MGDHRVGGRAGLTAAHSVDGEHAELVGGEGQQLGDVVDGLAGRGVDLVSLIPGPQRIVHPASTRPHG